MHLLLDAVEAGDISRSALGWNRRVRLMRDTEGAVKERARELLRVSDAARPDVMRAYEAALDLSGDAGRGQGVYFSACARCHGVGGEAVLFGPDLGTVRHWPPRALLEAILVPERSIADGYALWRLERLGEAPLTGILRAETPSSVTLVTEDGREEVALRTSIETLRRLDASPMPPGLEETSTCKKWRTCWPFCGNDNERRLRRAVQRGAHGFRAREFYPGASGFLSPGGFQFVEAHPVFVTEIVRAAVANHALRRFGGRRLRTKQASMLHIFQHAGCRLDGIGLVRADDAGGASFDPSSRVFAGHRLAGRRVCDAALLVRNNVPRFVEGNAREGYAPIPYGAEDQSGGNRFEPARGPRAQPPVVGLM